MKVTIFGPNSTEEVEVDKTCNDCFWYSNCCENFLEKDFTDQKYCCFEPSCFIERKNFESLNNKR